MPWQFPSQMTPFVGRIKELADVGANLANPACRLLTITGAGGSGKTRLALAAAQASASLFSQGAVFVGLQPIGTPDLLVQMIARALDFSFDGSAPPPTQLFHSLRDQSLLLVLDNFEHLLDGAPFVSELLYHAAGVKVLVTSREPLNLQEEWLYPLKGMTSSLNQASSTTEEGEAVQLFLYHARRMQPDFNFTEQREAVTRICTMAEGLPLAIELAASWLKGLSADQIAAEMQCNLDFLTTTARNIEERHRSMRAVFDQSWKLLSEAERRTFVKLTVFRGGFDREAAEQVAGASLPLLVALVEKSLLQTASSDRFGVHTLLCQYGTEKLEAYGEAEATHARHSQHFAQRMIRYGSALKQRQQLEAMQAIESDFENIRRAWDWAAEHQQADDLHAMLNGLYLFGFSGSRYRETIALFQQTLDQPIADAQFRGRLQARRWGYLQWWYQTDYAEALASIDRASTIARQDNNLFELAFCQLVTAYILINTERYAEALPHLESSQALFEAIDEPYYLCWVLHRLGYVYSSLNDTEKSIAYTEQSLALARVSHDRSALVICLFNLGSDYLLTGDTVRGQRYAAEVFQVATETGHQSQIAHALTLLALCAFCTGDISAARDHAERAQAMIEAFDSPALEPYCRALLIVLACIQEDTDTAIQIRQRTKHKGTSTTDSIIHTWALAVLACSLDHPVEARAYIDKVLLMSDYDANPVLMRWMVPSVAYAIAETQPEKAVELLAWMASSDDPALNWVRQWSLFDRLECQLQAALDGDSFDQHWEKGEALTLQAVKTFFRSGYSTSASESEEASPLLTAREVEILRLLALGLTNPQIADQLVIGLGTVKTHTLHIYRKLEVANRSQALLRAQELGLLTAEAQP